MFAESLEILNAPIIISRIFPSRRKVDKKRASNGCIFPGSDQIKELKADIEIPVIASSGSRFDKQNIVHLNFRLDVLAQALNKAHTHGIIKCATALSANGRRALQW
jgi:hypothetical protein